MYYSLKTDIMELSYHQVNKGQISKIMNLKDNKIELYKQVFTLQIVSINESKINKLYTISFTDGEFETEANFFIKKNKELAKNYIVEIGNIEFIKVDSRELYKFKLKEIKNCLLEQIDILYKQKKVNSIIDIEILVSKYKKEDDNKSNFSEKDFSFRGSKGGMSTHASTININEYYEDEKSIENKEERKEEVIYSRKKNKNKVKSLSIRNTKVKEDYSPYISNKNRSLYENELVYDNLESKSEKVILPFNNKENYVQGEKNNKKIEDYEFEGEIGEKLSKSSIDFYKKFDQLDELIIVNKSLLLVYLYSKSEIKRNSNNKIFFFITIFDTEDDELTIIICENKFIKNEDYINNIYNQLIVNRVYEISNYETFLSNSNKPTKLYSSSMNIRISENTKFRLINEEIGKVYFPNDVSFKFGTLKLVDVYPNTNSLDIILIVLNKDNIEIIQTKKGEKPKLSLIVGCSSGYYIKLNIWGYTANRIYNDIKIGSILLCKSLYISEYNGYWSLSSFFLENNILVLNENLSSSLKKKYKYSIDTFISNISKYKYNNQIFDIETSTNKSRNSIFIDSQNNNINIFREGNEVELIQFRYMQMKNDDSLMMFIQIDHLVKILNINRDIPKEDWDKIYSANSYTIKGRLIPNFIPERFIYPSCEKCKKKLDQDNDWFCNKCQESRQNPKYVYFFSLEFRDSTGKIKIKFSDYLGEKILNLKAEDFNKMLIQCKDLLLSQLNKLIYYEFLIKVKPQLDIYNGSTNIGFLALSVEVDSYGYLINMKDYRNELCSRMLCSLDFKLE